MESALHEPESRDLEDGSPVDRVLLVRSRERRQTRTDARFMRLPLADRMAAVSGIVWEDVEHASASARAGEPVPVTGTFSAHPRYGRQVTVRTLRIPEEVDWTRLIGGPHTALAELERQLEAPLASRRRDDVGSVLRSQRTTPRGQLRAHSAHDDRALQP
jgi:hypothetical protein